MCVPVQATNLYAAYRAVGAEDRIGDLVQEVRILRVRLDDQPLALGALCLHVVLPEVSLSLGAAWTAARCLSHVL